jgi:serine/threonine protein kinase
MKRLSIPSGPGPAILLSKSRSFNGVKTIYRSSVACSDEQDSLYDGCHKPVMARRMTMTSLPFECVEWYEEQTNLIKPERLSYLSVTGANLNMDWLLLKRVEFLVDGGNNWLYSACLNGKACAVKTIKPKFRNDPVAIEDLEREVRVHAVLDHPHIVALLGAGLTPQGERFIVFEKLDGGDLSETLGFDKKSHKKKYSILRRDCDDAEPLSFIDVLKHARSVASALQYCHTKAIPGSMILHRDLKPENIVFSSDGMLKIIDFGLARIVTDASSDSNMVYGMSAKTGSYRYMSPEVALSMPYNHKADVYSFGKVKNAHWPLLCLSASYND